MLKLGKRSLKGEGLSDEASGNHHLGLSFRTLQLTPSLCAVRLLKFAL